MAEDNDDKQHKEYLKEQSELLERRGFLKSAECKELAQDPEHWNFKVDRQIELGHIRRRLHKLKIYLDPKRHTSQKATKALEEQTRRTVRKMSKSNASLASPARLWLAKEKRMELAAEKFAHIGQINAEELPVATQERKILAEERKIAAEERKVATEARLLYSKTAVDLYKVAFEDNEPTTELSSTAGSSVSELSSTESGSSMPALVTTPLFKKDTIGIYKRRKARVVYVDFQPGNEEAAYQLLVEDGFNSWDVNTEESLLIDDSSYAALVATKGPVNFAYEGETRTLDMSALRAYSLEFSGGVSFKQFSTHESMYDFVLTLNNWEKALAAFDIWIVYKLFEKCEDDKVVREFATLWAVPLDDPNLNVIECLKALHKEFGKLIGPFK